MNRYFLLLLLVVASFSYADYEKGLQCYRSNDYPCALIEFMANHDSAFAKTFLGLIYANGQGVKQDYAEAIKSYRLAADQGNAEAQFSLV